MLLPGPTLESRPPPPSKSLPCAAPPIRPAVAAGPIQFAFRNAGNPPSGRPLRPEIRCGRRNGGNRTSNTWFCSLAAKWNDGIVKWWNGEWKSPKRFAGKDIQGHGILPSHELLAAAIGVLAWCHTHHSIIPPFR